MIVTDDEFNLAVDEFLARTREMIGLESEEDVPPPFLPESEKQRTAVPSALMLDEEIIRRYALSIGDDNPLFTDSNYAKASPYDSVIAPGPILVHARYPGDHGATRPHGYPLANFIGGVSWEFFDVIRAGTRISTSKILREVLEKRSLHGRLFQLVCEVNYVDERDRLLAKAYGTIIEVPVRAMGVTRAMPLDKLGQELFSERKPHRYTPEEVNHIIEGMKSERRRGNEVLFWEDVAVGEEILPIYQPPYTLADALAYQSIHQGLTAGHQRGRFARSFTPAYRVLKAGWGYPDFARVHPVTRWPYTPGDEHEDPLLCSYRGEPLPFDFGIQRAQIPQRLLSNWMGDHGFIRKMSITMGRPLFYGDALIVRGRVAAKTMVRQPGTKTQYHAIRVAIEATNQRQESVSRGFATIYLPSRVSREPIVPIVPIELAAPPPYVPFDEHQSPSWY